LADKATQLILAALSRAVAEPAGVPLHGRTGAIGLFAGTASAKLAAQRCKEAGYLQTVRTETRGKSTREICAITEKGMAHLLSQVSPKQVLEDLIRVLDARQTQTRQLLESARQMQTTLDAVKVTAEKMLHQVQQPSSPPGLAVSTNGTHEPRVDFLPFLNRWQESSSSEDCPLPDLFRQGLQNEPQMTIGQFHDILRRLHDQERIYLHPWTGPLYAIPEPPYALLVGHEIAYYASARR
jgi:hypothetical protein